MTARPTMHDPPAAPDDPPPVERRLSERVRVDVGATLHQDSFFCGVRVLDVSEGGACLDAAVDLAAGSSVALAFPLDDDVVMARGEVRWVRGSVVGVAFTYLSTFDGKAIAAFCRIGRTRRSGVPER